MFKLLRKIEYSSTSRPINLNLDDVIEGVNYLEDFIIYRKDNNFKIYSRICDHAGGKIISRKGENICPMHNWKFDPISGKYSNGLKKKELNYKIDNKNLNLEKKILKPQIKKFVKKDKKTNIRFFNHEMPIHSNF